MIQRLLIAAAGAVIVTIGLFLGMSEFAAVFERTDSARYLRVFDVFAGSGRRRPDIRLPAAQPQRPALEQTLEAAVIEANPQFDGEVEPPRPALDLEQDRAP